MVEITAKIAKTIEAAPLRPTQDINKISFKDALKNFIIINVAIGLATRIIKIEIDTP